MLAFTSIKRGYQVRLCKAFNNVVAGAQKIFSCGVKHVFGFVYPSFCIFCDTLVEPDGVCCNLCLANINSPATCELEVTRARSIRIYALGDYRGSLRRLLMGKFNGDRSASRRLATLVTKRSDFSLFNDECINKKAILVPMPLHWSRLASRGFNQAHVMANVYHERFGIPINELIVRARRTAFQSLLPKKKRMDNVKNAFCLNVKCERENRDFFKDKHLILVDDLCTTGETLKAAVKPLLHLRAASISAVVICRVL